MYAYCKHPDTLPSSYYKFIVETGPIPEFVLDQARKQISEQPVDVERINTFWSLSF